jgi:hypothetical protein
MAIRSIANQKKFRKEKKSRTHKESSDKVSNTAVKDTTTFTGDEKIS